jgi:ribosome maturation factor RimP
MGAAGLHGPHRSVTFDRMSGLRFSPVWRGASEEVGSGCPAFFCLSLSALAMPEADLGRELERRVEELGYEIVELERAGSPRRPIIRLRIDRAGATPESSVSVEDCTRVSRALEPFLDDFPGLDPSYNLEVSSPGVERPLVRSRDFERFAGREVALTGRSPLAGRARRLEGVLVGLLGNAPDEHVVIRLPDGEEISVPRAEVKRVNLVFRWGGAKRRS